jgi:hypothetical protein
MFQLKAGQFQKAMTDKELESEYVRAMGSDLGQLCGELRDDVDWLRRKWSNFKELFGKGQERIDLLNKVASNFFYSLHRLLFEDAMLHLCRLSDAPKTRLRTGDRENLSVLALTDIISNPALKASVQTTTQQVRKSCECARKWRNQRLAHTDLISRRKGYAFTLPPVTASDIESALKSISDLLTLVEDHYGIPRSVLGSDPWGAKSLLHHLEEADKAIEKKHEQWRKLAAKA